MRTGDCDGARRGNRKAIDARAKSKPILACKFAKLFSTNGTGNMPYLIIDGYNLGGRKPRECKMSLGVIRGINDINGTASELNDGIYVTVFDVGFVFNLYSACSRGNSYRSRSASGKGRVKLRGEA